MGKLIHNKDGTHTFVGGFNSADPKDMQQLKPMFQEKMSIRDPKPKEKSSKKKK